ncbi:MAG: SIS domain-containing protein [Actinomycetota bacterium]|nr:SIS domain-containing protein [Actinomycetota bacterium]
MTARLLERERALSAFLDEYGERLTRACHDVARALGRGGVLLAHGAGSAATDAARVAVGFMHPVVDGKRSLPALAPSNDPTGATLRAQIFRGDDIALSLTHGPVDEAARAFLDAGARRGALTVALVGAGGGAPRADHTLTVDSEDPHVVQEVQQLACHLLWELVHAFFERPGVLEDACITCGDIALPGRVVALTEHGATVDFDGLCEDVACELIEGVAQGDVLLCHAGVALERLDAGPEEGPVPASFVYPFLERVERDIDVVLREVRESIAQKGREVLQLQRGLDVAEIEGCARKIRRRLMTGGRVLTFGNGDSAAASQDFAGDLLDQGWTALALGNDAATVTALGDDEGFENVFARQILTLGHSRDVAIALSVSGSSQNLLQALAVAHHRGMKTCVIVAHPGGLIGQLDWLDHVLWVPSDDVTRAQEAQATISHLILEAIGSPT